MCNFWNKGVKMLYCMLLYRVIYDNSNIIGKLNKNYIWKDYFRFDVN